MKRNAPETVDSRSSKRLKAGSSKEDDDANFQPLLARCPRDLVTLAAQGKKLPKPPGHLRGTIVRKLNTTVPKDRLFLIKVPVLTTKTRQQLQFEVLFRSRVQGDLDSLNSLKAGDEVLLSLKGASAPAAAQAHSEPFRLTYHTGFHLKWKGREFNTWNGTVKQSSSSPVKEPEEHSPQLTKRQQRLLRRQQKEDNDPSEGPCATKDGPGRQETPVKEEMHSQPIPPPRSPGPPAPSEAQQRPVDHLESNTETMALLKSLGYTTLKKAVAKSAVSYGDLIGVVVGCRELRQSSRGDGDWNRQIRIVDPSMVDEDDILSIKGFGVILFANQKDFLPDPIVGDVLVLHNIRLSNNHLPAVGNRSGGFRWALYSGNGFHHGVNSVTVLTEGASTPMFHPPQSHVAAAAALKEWWAGVESKQNDELDKSRVSDPSISVQLGRPMRQHRLISEVTPETEPDGYFDCTVEVLHHFKNDNGVLTLHVTDYTRNPRTHASQADWCPNGLSEYVLKIEVWDDEGTATWAEKARLEGKLSYCKLSNVKMRLSAGNYFEGKLRERKIIAFDEDSHDSRLKALLSRKAEFNKVHREAETEYEDRLLSDAIPEQFFNCVVEVLHVEIPDTSKTVFVYVTDYTRRLDLDLSNDEWAKNLKGMVVMVKLQDQQADRARLKIVKPGAYYQFRKLRLRARRLHGTLGGSQALIQQLGNNSPLVEDLLRRKREIQGKSSWLPNSRLGEIRSSTAKLPRKHRVYAKILGYQPKKLENAIYQWCSNCKKDVDWLRRRCFDCEAKPHVVSRLTLLIEDKAGDKAYVNVPLKAELFSGIDHSNLIGGGINLEFERRVNILTTPQDDPFHALVIVAWKDDNEALMFALENVNC